MASVAEKKEAIRRWAIRQQEIQSYGTVVATSESKEAQLKRIERARRDYAYFVSY